MKSKRFALLCVIVFVGAVTSLHWYVNINGSSNADRDTVKRFRVGFLPVT